MTGVEPYVPLPENSSDTDTYVPDMRKREAGREDQGITPEIRKALDYALEKYADVWRKLADR